MNKNFRELMGKLILLLTVYCLGMDALAQTPLPDSVKAEGKNNLRYTLNESGTHYFQVTFLNQVWVRYDESNPGTTVDNLPVEHTFDIGLRRTRIQLYGQLTDHTFLYFQFGQKQLQRALRQQQLA